MRSVMASRLPTKTGGVVRRATDVVDAVCVVLVEAMEVELVGVDFVVEGLEECFDLWPLVVLNGLAMGARLIVPSEFLAGFFFVVAVSIAEVERPAEAMKRSSAMEVRRSNIYCTPMGLTTFSGWAVAEMAGWESFGESG